MKLTSSKWLVLSWLFPKQKWTSLILILIWYQRPLILSEAEKAPQVQDTQKQRVA